MTAGHVSEYALQNLFIPGFSFLRQSPEGIKGKLFMTVEVTATKLFFH